jgi:hypothetical protein
LNLAFASGYLACGDCWAGVATGCRLTLALAIGWLTCSACKVFVDPVDEHLKLKEHVLVILIGILFGWIA